MLSRNVMEQKLSKLLRSSKTFLLQSLVFLALSLPVSVVFPRFSPLFVSSLTRSLYRFISPLSSSPRFTIRLQERGKNTGIVEYSRMERAWIFFWPLLSPVSTAAILLLQTVSSSTSRQVPSYIFKKDGSSSNALHS